MNWSTEGVVMTGHYKDSNNKTFVACQSFHLTAFAVLVAVNGIDVIKRCSHF